jgi:hypothetical protein
MTPFTAALLAASQIARAGGAFADRAASQLDSLRGGATPSAWLASHPGDALLLFRRDSIRENHESWCARASLVERLADGTRMTRFAYFYPPQAPSSLSLPAVGGATLIQDQCVLGTVWIETQVADSATGAALATSVRETLTRAHGPVKTGPDVLFGRTPTDSQRRLLSRLPGADAMLLGIHFSGAAGWRIPGRWQVDSTVIVSAFDGGLGNRPVGGRVVAFAYLPIAQLGSFRAQSEREEAAERRTAALAQNAARLSGLDRVRTDRLTGLLVAAESAYTGRHPTNSRALMAFRHHVSVLWKRTLSRRSQKATMTWQRMLRLVKAWLPPPRILHPWPAQRFDVKHPRWEPSA